MPGHIFFRIGDYARAEQAFAASMQVDERYMREQHVQPDNDWNYVHNLMYAIANLMEEGKLKASDRTIASSSLQRAASWSPRFTFIRREIRLRGSIRDCRSRCERATGRRLLDC